MDFLIDIDKDLELPSYRLVLCRPDESPVISIAHSRGVEAEKLFVGIDSVKFHTPLYVQNSNGSKLKNPAYDLILNDYLIKLNDMDYFVITSAREVSSSNGNKYKEVVCKSREYSLSDKKLTDYEADSRMLYDPENQKLDGLDRGVLNYIFNDIAISWKVGYIDPDVIIRNDKKVHRGLKFSDDNLTKVFADLQKTFNCVFFYDTVKKEVNVYDVSNVKSQDRGFLISDKNFIKEITKDIDSEGLVTRLYLRGEDNVSIQSISPIGQPYIDNFSYYKNTLYMTEGLIAALDRYDKKVKDYSPQFEPKLIALKTANSELEILKNSDGEVMEDKGLVALNRSLSSTQTLIDVKVEELGIIKNSISQAEGSMLSDLHKKKKKVEVEIKEHNNKKTEINSYIKIKENEISAKENTIKDINNELDILRGELNTSNENNFTKEQIMELDNYIKTDTFSDSSYTAENIDELMEEGKRQLQKLSQPKVQFEIDVIDFLSLVEYQHVWDKLKLGDTITIKHEDIGVDMKVRLVGYNHSKESNSLTLQFSNRYSFDDDVMYERDLIDKIDDVSTAVDFGKDRWNSVGEIENRFSKLVDTKLEESRQNILNAVGQQHLFGDDGLWLYKENPDGTIHDEQIRAINNTIALTSDSWATVGTAITPRGVVAEHIYGKLGSFAKVSAEQIEVGGFEGDESQKVENNIKDYIDSIDINLKGQIDGKVDTWFYGETPTLDNPPASSWSTNAIKDKHVDDLYFDTSAGHTYRFKRDGSAYSWERIKDKDIMDAMSKASAAQDTADGKRRIFTSTPYAPYDVGDMWRVTDIEGVDFKICVTPQQTGLCSSLHWVNVDKGKEYMDDIETNFAVKHGEILSKVSEVKTDTDGLKTRVESAEQKITPGAITSVVESNTTALAKKSDIPNTSGFATKSDITQSANDVRFEFKNIKNPNGTDASISSGVTTINKDGVRVSHTGSGGQYSEIRADGFVRKWQYGEARYLNDIFIASFEYSNGRLSDIPTSNPVTLPQSFYGREIEIFLSINNMTLLLGRVSRGYLTELTEAMYTTLKVNRRSGLTIYVDSYIDQRYVYERSGGNWYYDTDYRRLGFTIMVVGK